MKTMKYLSLLLLVVLTMSCEKNEIKFDSKLVGDQAEFQLHYMVPVVANAANYITRVEINSQMISNKTNILSTYNAIPSAAVGRFYTAETGDANIKMYMTGKVTLDSLVYDQNVTLANGKQNIFVHSFTGVPVAFNNGYPFEPNVQSVTDTIAWVKFYNFLYETAGVPSAKNIQYQYVNTKTTKDVNLGDPLLFGQATDWIPVAVHKTDIISSGSRTITFKMKEVDALGNLTDLKIMNTSGSYVNYSATATLVIGRRYHHIMAGFRAVKSPNSSVRVFTAL